MPVRVQKRGNVYCAVEPGGGRRKGRCHDTAAQARAQASAINISMARKRGHRIPRPGK